MTTTRFQADFIETENPLDEKSKLDILKDCFNSLLKEVCFPKDSRHVVVRLKKGKELSAIENICENVLRNVKAFEHHTNKKIPMSTFAKNKDWSYYTSDFF